LQKTRSLKKKKERGEKKIDVGALTNDPGGEKAGLNPQGEEGIYGTKSE